MTQPFQSETSLSSLADQIKQGVTVDSPSTQPAQQQQGQEPEQNIPYARFQQVLQQRNELEAQLAERARQQAAQQGQGYQQVQAAGQEAAQSLQQVQELLTQDEQAALDNLVLTNPGEAMRQVSQVIMDRGVRQETARIQRELREEFGKVASGFAAQMAPMALNQYKQSKFGGPVANAAPIFDQLVAEEMKVNPGVINNPTSLDYLRQMAIGRAYETGAFNQPARANLPFSEQAGSGANFTPQTPQADQSTLAVNKLLGLDEKTTNVIHNVFETNGVYR